MICWLTSQKASLGVQYTTQINVNAGNCGNCGIGHVNWKNP